MKYLFIAPIRLYQILISPFLGHNCRYCPSCSNYVMNAIRLHGVFKGLTLGTKRIFSCHPWSQKDIDDPVPEQFAWKDILSYKNATKK